MSRPSLIGAYAARDTFHGVVRAVRRRYASKILLACPAQDISCQSILLEGVKQFKSQHPHAVCEFTLLSVSNVDELLLHIIRTAPCIVVTIGTTLLRTAVGSMAHAIRQRVEDVHGQLLHSSSKHLVFPLLDTASQRRLSGEAAPEREQLATGHFAEDLRKFFSMISVGDFFGASGAV